MKKVKCPCCNKTAKKYILGNNVELIKEALRTKKWITTTEIGELIELNNTVINRGLKNLNRHGIVLSQYFGNTIKHYILE